MHIIPGLQKVEWRRTLGKQRPEDVFQVRAHGVEILQGRTDVVLEKVGEDSAVVALAERLPQAVPRQPGQVLFRNGGDARADGRGRDRHFTRGR